MINETPIMTEANKKVLAIKRRKAAVPDRVFSLDTLRSNAEILDECGGGRQRWCSGRFWEVIVPVA